jgi:hypothetical protein
MTLAITYKRTQWGLYLTTTYKGCKYGQAFNDGETAAEAAERFRRYVWHLSRGEWWRVTA